MTTPRHPLRLRPVWSAVVRAVVTSIAPARLDTSGQEPAVRMVPDEGEALKYWPRWRGPSGQGLVAGSGYVDTWSLTQTVVWKTPLGGHGNPSPIVWRDQIILTTAYDDDCRSRSSPTAGRPAPGPGATPSAGSPPAIVRRRGVPRQGASLAR